MRVITFGLGLALALTLTSCGGSPPRTTKKKTEPAPAAPVLPTPPAAAKKPAPAKTTSSSAAKSEGSAPAGDAPAAPVGDAAPKEALSSDVQMPGGKTVDSWSRLLDSKNKTEVLEALEMVRLQGHAFKPIKAKVEGLTKNADAEIAKAAQEAVAAIK